MWGFGTLLACDHDVQIRPAASSTPGVESVLATDLLYRRTPRPARPVAERRALDRLGRAIVESPQSIFQTLTDVAVEVCEADTAGISILENDDHGGHFRWRAISGKYAAHLGGMTPRDFSPCGTTIDRNAPQLVSRPGRYFSYFNEVQPPIVEGLLVPFSVAERPVGTMWLVAHDERRKFDSEDTRVLIALANFAAAGYELLSALDEKRNAVTAGDPLLPSAPLRINHHEREALSKRENEVMTMMVRGVTQKAIALSLQISVKTVATYRARILRKLNLNGSYDLLRYALQNRLVEWSEVH